MQEQRRLPRWNINRQAKIKLSGAYAYANCFLKDLNLRGLQFVLKIKLPADKFFSLFLSLSDEVSLETEVYIAWHKAIAGGNIYGVYFTKIRDGDKNKIYEFMRSNFPGQVDNRWWEDKEEGGGKMKQDKSEDKRVFARFQTQFPVRLLDSRSNKEINAETCDISAKGAGIISDAALTPNSSLEVWFDIPDKGGPLYTRGEVVWSKKTADGRYRSGINLEKADLMGLGRVLRNH